MFQNQYKFFNTNNNKKCWSHVASDESEAASIATTKEFIKAAKEEGPVITLKAMEEWQSVVMDSNIPVVLDCYAEWCAPCKKLDPKLTEKVISYDGKIKLVKLNIDDFP